MKTRPILFSGPMVRAILAGTKTQTRRVVKPQPGPSCRIEEGMDGESPFVYSALYGDGPGHDVHESRTACRCPYGQPGDRLYVREHWCASRAHDHLPPRDIPAGDAVEYLADGPTHVLTGKARRAFHMPRWASRITLEVTGVRVERLQDISEADAIAEGCALECMTPTGDDIGSAIHGPGGYRALWESINGTGSWESNPWVWVLEFKRVAP